MTVASMGKSLFNSHIDDKGIILLEDSQTSSDPQEYIAMSEKLAPYKLNVNGEMHDIGSNRITAGSLKEKLRYPSHFWVTIEYQSGELEDLDDDNEIIVNVTKKVSIVSDYEGGLHTLPSLQYRKLNPELKRLDGRLAMETTFLRRVKNYGNVTFKIVNDGSEAFVFVPKLDIGAQWNKQIVDIFIKVPTQSPCYPTLKLDNFFVSKDLRTLDGRMPAYLWVDEDFDWLDKRFLEDGYAQFSFHVKEWRPNHDPRQFTSGDSLVSYLNAISVLLHRPAKVR